MLRCASIAKLIDQAAPKATRIIYELMFIIIFLPDFVNTFLELREYVEGSRGFVYRAGRIARNISGRPGRAMMVRFAARASGAKPLR
jgi:hypothetical protein